MRLIRTDLLNVCRHRDQSIDWSPGLNGIIGPNGSGKSTIAKAVKFALTGAFDNAGLKEQNIAQLASGRASRVVQQLEHNGHDIEVVRVLRGGRSQLRVDGGAAIYGDIAVTNTLLEVLGTDTRILGEYIFVGQNAIFDFLDATDARRAEAFQSLFNTRRAQEVYDLCTEFGKVEALPPRSDELDLLARRIAANQARLTALVEERRDYEDLNHYDAEADPNRQVVDRWGSNVQARADLLRANTELAGLRADDSPDAIAGLEAAQRQLDAAVADSRADVDHARVLLATWKTIAARRRDLALARARVGALEQEEAAHAAPTRPDDYQTQAAWQEQIHAVIRRNTPLRTMVETFHAGVAACPVCGTASDQLTARIADAREQLAAGEAVLEALEAAARVSDAYDNAATISRTWRPGFVQRFTEARQRLDSCMAEQEVPPDVAEADLAEVVAAFEALIKDRDAMRARLRDAEAARATYTTAVEVAAAKVRDLQARAAATFVRYEVYDDARLALEEMLERIERRGRLDGEIRTLRQQVVDDQGSHHRLLLRERGHERSRQWVRLLGQVQAHVHWSALPRRVAEARLVTLMDDTNSLLEGFGSPFRVAGGDRLVLDCNFLDGRTHPASRLSDGEKTLLAIAFRVAVNSLFASTLGLICLDEPTQSLDQQNLACVEVALRRLRELSASRGLQCLMVTHEASLGGIFDVTIQLAA